MFSEITLPSQELFDLRTAITDDCCVLDTEHNYLLIVIERTEKIWEESGFGRRLTLEECVYVADGIRNRYNIPFENQTYWGNLVFGIIGGEETNRNSIFSIIKVGLIGIFAYAAYRIVKK